MEVGLTALGVGLPPGVPSLGNLVANALVAINMQQRVWNWLPAIIMLFILMITINYVNQAISRAANAQQRRS
jgi:peptide/nickel transport system permease protein